MILPLASIIWGMVQINLICAITLLITMLLRGRRPQFASALLAGCCIHCLVLGVLIWVPISHWSVVPLLANHASHSVGPPFQGHLENDGSGSQKTSNDHSKAANAEPDVSSLVPSDARPMLVASTRWLLDKFQRFDESVRSTEQTATSPRSVWASRAIIAFAFGFTAMAGLWVCGWNSMRSVVRESNVLTDADLRAKVRRFADQLGLGREPQLCISPHIPIGATVGWLRHVIVLNRDWRNWRESELDAVLLHELAHVVRHDFLWMILGSWVRVLFFFNPLSHLVVRRLRMEQELAADQLAAGLLKNAQAYGRALASLALRCERTFRAPRPMLAAEQVCVIRRITMLRQGRLVPLSKPWRWATFLTLASSIIIVPLSGLRGMPSTIATANPSVDSQSSDDEPSNSPREIDVKANEQRALAEAINLTYPPLEFRGQVIWQPGRFQEETFNASIRWMHAIVSAAMWNQVPEKATIYGQSNFCLGWTDMERNHGNLTAGVMIKEADQIDPKIVSELLTNPAFGPLRKSNETKQIGGQIVSGIVREKYDSSGKLLVSEQPETWTVESQGHFFHGTDKEIEEHLQGNSDLLKDVPEAFRSDYLASGFAAVYSDCNTWEARVQSFAKGSPKAVEFAIVMPLLAKLESYGIFFKGSRDEDCFVRALYVDEAAADQAKHALESLIAVAKRQSMAAGERTPRQETAGDPPFDFDALAVEHVGSELRIHFGSLVGIYAQAMKADMFSHFPGWISTMTQWESGLPCDTELKATTFGSSPTYLAQSLSAKNYRGQQVRIQAEMAVNPTVEHRVGLFLWTSDAKDRSCTFESRAVDGETTLQSIASDRDQEIIDNTDVPWQIVSVEVDVPDNAEVLSYGVYGKNVCFRLKNLELVATGDQDTSRPSSAALLPINIFAVPGIALPESPTNLKFIVPSKPEERVQEEVAERDAKVVR